MTDPQLIVPPEVEAALARFGWEATEEFRHRYWTDLLIYNLANALARSLPRQPERSP